MNSVWKDEEKSNKKQKKGGERTGVGGRWNFKYGGRKGGCFQGAVRSLAAGVEDLRPGVSALE